jgi:CHAT domain-containing protein
LAVKSYLILLWLVCALSGCGLVFRPLPVYESAWLELKQGDLELALRDADRGLTRYPDPAAEWHWRFKILKAEILVWQHRNEESLALNRQDLPSSLVHSDLAVWRKLSQCAASAYIQKLDDAERYLAEADALARAYHPELWGQVALRKGTFLFWKGSAAEGQGAYRDALEFARREKDLFLEAAALGSLGVAAAKQEHYDEALDWNRKALQLSQTIGARSSVARILGNLGWSFRELGDFENARIDYEQAEEASAQNGQVGDQIYWLTGIASVDYLQHEYRSAESVLTQALDLARKQDDKTIPIEYLNDLAEIALETGQTETAERYYAEASEIERDGLDQSVMRESLLVRGRIADTKHHFAHAEECFRQLIRDPKAGAAQRWEAEARLARVYAEETRYAQAEQEFRQSLATIESVRSSVQAEDLRLSFLSSAISFYDDYVGFLISRHRTEDALQVAELSRSRTLTEGLGAAPKTPSFPLRDFQPQRTAKRTNSVLLFYWLGQKKSYVWVITPTKMICATLPGATEIDPLVKSYRVAVLSGRDVLEGGDSNGEKLYTLLIEPVRKLIPPGSRVILLPDGSLYGLNFETLLVPGPKLHFWIEDVTLTSASSLTLLSAARNSSTDNNSIGRSVGVRQLRGIHQRFVGAAFDTEHRDPAASFRNGNLLLVGDATQAAAEFPVLRQARAEMAQVGRYFPESRRAVLAGPQATPGKFLASGPERFAYLHFVTHGSASRAHPLDSAVILSPDGDSFKLYARDIVKHPLSAYLVTISACSGSGTRAYSGEGLVGLSWAFLRAGAHNVIAALWEVNDASTPQLMDKLYGELNRGQDPACALRAAKLSLIKSDSVFKKPFYWAPFQLYSGSRATRGS